jgi:outer membrane protein, heavy metal efflux system
MRHSLILFSIVIVLCLRSSALCAGDGAQGAHAPDSLITLDSLVQQVLQNNPSLQASRIRIQGAEARISQATAWDDPQAGVEFYMTPVTSANPFKDGMETDYFVQQMIPLGKKGAMADAARANVRVVEQQSRSVERNLVAQVKTTYAMLYAAQRRLDVNEESERLLNQIVESARGKYSVGNASQSDVLKAQVELAKLQNERSTIEQELRAAEAMVNALRALPSSTPVPRVAEIQIRESPATLEELQEKAWQNRPEIRAMQSEIEMNKAELTASGRELIPDLMLKGTYKQMKEGTDFWAAMVGISIPIAPWSSGKYSGRSEESEVNIRSGELDLADMKNMAASNVRDAWTRTASRLDQVRRYRGTILPQAEQTLQSTLVSYQTDKTDFLSLLDSYRMVQMLRMEYYMLVSEYLTSYASLEKAVGTSLE